MNINDELIHEIIENRSIYVDFQPIYSFNTKKIIGLEALSRGKIGDEQISPYFMFDYAKKHGETLMLDRLCREKAMEAFPKENDSSTLFINFETSVLNDVVPGNGEILKTAEENNISPENIVIELNETNVRDAYNLLMFVDFYRSRGFLIALDNVSNGLETQNRIMLINPDIIKIDRAIVSNISSNTYNQEVFKSIINTAKQIGAMTVAEGVETVDEVIACMLMGVDYFQGFYFSKPERFDYIYSNEARLKLEEAAQHLNVSMKKNPTVANVKLETYKRIIFGLINRITGISPDRYTSELEAYVTEHKEIECAFLIDSKGFQLTPTVLQKDTEILSGYTPALIGVNHDIKNYFYAIKEQIEDPFISGWYISAATGQSCKTISSHFYNSNGELIVVCVDLKRKQS
ncbi:MAG: EAL domain-containing protein [Oscillospiraceae bacterium]